MYMHPWLESMVNCTLSGSCLRSPWRSVFITCDRLTPEINFFTLMNVKSKAHQYACRPNTVNLSSICLVAFHHLGAIRQLARC
jgi:hypothetical protein